MNHLHNGVAYAEQWPDIATEFDDDDEVFGAEFDDDDEGFVGEFDDDDESFDVEFDDDDEGFAGEFDDDDERFDVEFDDDDEGAGGEGEFFSALMGIRKLAKMRRRRRSSSFYRPRNFLRHKVGKGRYRFQPRSSLRGRLKVGRRVLPFRLPRNLATKQDIKTLATQVRKDIRLNSVAIKKNAAGIRSAIGLARKANAGVKQVDKKYRRTTLRQTKVTNEIRKRLDKLKKAQEAAQAQARQQAMFSLFMSPELEKIKLKPIGGGPEVEWEVTDSEFETNLLPLIMGMQGGGGGTQGGMDPMMMFALIQAMDND